MNWQARISRPDAPAVPIRINRMHRTFWCPPGYERLVRYVASHPEFTQREAAKACGYSLGGLERAMARLVQWGALLVQTVRGRSGGTRAQVQTDVRTANVSGTERVFLRPSLRVGDVVSVVGTLMPGTGLAAWRELAGTFGAAR